MIQSAADIRPRLRRAAESFAGPSIFAAGDIHHDSITSTQAIAALCSGDTAAVAIAVYFMIALLVDERVDGRATSRQIAKSRTVPCRTGYLFRAA